MGEGDLEAMPVPLENDRLAMTDGKGIRPVARSLWEFVLEYEPDPEAALMLLADAVAIGLVQQGSRPALAIERISAACDSLLAVKHPECAR